MTSLSFRLETGGPAPAFVLLRWMRWACLPTLHHPGLSERQHTLFLFRDFRRSESAITGCRTEFVEKKTRVNCIERGETPGFATLAEIKPSLNPALAIMAERPVSPEAEYSEYDAGHHDLPSLEDNSPGFRARANNDAVAGFRCRSDQQTFPPRVAWLDPARLNQPV